MTATTHSVPPAIRRWHEIVATRDPGGLDELLADDVVFLSPVVHTPQRGKEITKAYLAAALRALDNESFRYVGEWFGARSAVLEFATVIDGIEVEGVDLISWNERDQIVTFKVMVRPLKAIQALQHKMSALLSSVQQQQQQ
jgi:hypothetical protein